MGFIKDILREIDEDVRFERRRNEYYRAGLKDKETYEDAKEYVENNLGDYKNVRLEGCFNYGYGLNMKISYTSIFGIRLNKEIQAVTKSSSDRFLKQLFLDNGCDFWKNKFEIKTENI